MSRSSSRVGDPGVVNANGLSTSGDTGITFTTTKRAEFCEAVKEQWQN